MKNSKMFSLVLMCACVSYVSGSAIPMWELLSKEEKLSYLYSMFAYQVEEFCEFSETSNCNQDLLKYGLAKLKLMSEDRLDTIDPYQRGASSIIWNSIMEGHSDAKKSKVQTTSVKPNSYEDNLSLGGSDDLGSQGLASAKIDNVYKVLPPSDFKYETPKSYYIIKTGTPEYRKPPKKHQSQLPFEDILHSTVFNDNIDNYYQNTPLTGPAVVRVRLDGTPVDDKVPQDDDLKHHQLSQILLPSL